ncbi:MAG: tryptophan synthase subunit beta [Bacteroidales bacterium]|jgi:tryptophan synthase beta chain|nr:tryptophan synthase subunit beta [Bacteroidales bacterium]
MMKTNTIEVKYNNHKTVNKPGYFGVYGGMYVPPILENKLKELSEIFNQLIENDEFIQEFNYYLNQYVGRPSPLYFANRLSEYVGSRIYLKREDLNHTGAHKINNTIGQILVAKYMGAKEIIAETGAGQHGVATATAAAMFGMKCKIFMGAVDAERQQLNAYRIKLLGAEFITTNRGTGTLKDAVDAALEYYVQHPDSFYILGSAVGPHPYPGMVRFFQSVIGTESRKQILEQEGRLPDSIFACVGGGSNAIGLFSGFLEDEKVKIFAAEGGGEGLVPGRTASTLVMGKPMVFQGTYSYCMADEDGNPIDTYSIAAGLDYPGVGPEHACLKDAQRAEYYCITDQEAVESFRLLSVLEGIIPAIESSHAVALAIKLLKNKNQLSIINLSGRGDKDVDRKLI